MLKNIKYITKESLYIGWISAEKGLSQNSIDSYRYDLQRLSAYLHDYNCNDVDVTVSMLENFVELLFDIGFATSSIQRTISTLRSYFGFLVSEDIISKNPAELLEIPKKSKKLPSVLSVNEIETILSHISKQEKKSTLRDKAIIELLYGCGLRVSELINIAKSNIIEEGTFFKIEGKGNKERVVPIGNIAQNCLKEYIELERSKFSNDKSGDILFINLRGAPLTRMGIWKIIKQYALELGFDKKVSPHTFRHSYATHLLEGGADLRVVQELLGHENITTTEIYTHIDRTHLMEVHRSFHPRNKK